MLTLAPAPATARASMSSDDAGDDGMAAEAALLAVAVAVVSTTPDRRPPINRRWGRQAVWFVDHWTKWPRGNGA
jgi:hypothetical protein